MEKQIKRFEKLISAQTTRVRIYQEGGTFIGSFEIRTLAINRQKIDNQEDEFYQCFILFQNK